MVKGAGQYEDSNCRTARGWRRALLLNARWGALYRETFAPDLALTSQVQPKMTRKQW